MSEFASSIFDLPGKLLGSDLTNGLASAMKGAQDLANTTLDKASGSFNNLAKDTLALVDKESLAATSTLTKFIDQQRGLLSTTLNKIKNGAVNLKDIAGAVDLRDGLTLDKDQLLNRVSGALGFPVSSIAGFKETLADSVLQTMSENTMGLTSELLTTDGGKITLNGRWRENMTDGLVSYFTRVGEDGTLGAVIDNPATKSFFDAMMEQSIKVGLFEGIGMLATKYNQSQDAKAAIANYSYYAVQQADVSTLSVIVDQIGSETLVAKNPDTIATVLSNFAFRPNTTADQYPTYLTELTSTLAKINPDWWQRQYMGQPMVDFAVFQNISEDALKLLRTDNRFAAACVLASQYRTESQINLVRQQYPLLAVAGDQPTT